MQRWWQGSATTSQSIAWRSRRGSGGLRQLLPLTATLTWCVGHYSLRCTHCLSYREPNLSLGDGSPSQAQPIGTVRKCQVNEVRYTRSRVCIASLQVATAALYLLSAGTSRRRDRTIPLSHVWFRRQPIVDVRELPHKLTLHMLQTC